MATYQAWDGERALAIVDRHRQMPGNLLPILHALQQEFGCIDEAAVPLLAEELNLSRADVHGVVSFYHDFRRTRPGRHVVAVCRAEACQAVGADRLVAHARRVLAVDLGGTTTDGALTLDSVFCLGNCALGPSLLADGQDLHGRVDAARFDAILAGLTSEAAP